MLWWCSRYVIKNQYNFSEQYLQTGVGVKDDEAKSCSTSSHREEAKEIIEKFEQ
jgi:hypothetical protein